MRAQMTLQRRHFKFIASVIAEIEDGNTRDMVCAKFLARLKPTNPDFRPEQFRDACKAVPPGWRDVEARYIDK